METSKSSGTGISSRRFRGGKVLVELRISDPDLNALIRSGLELRSGYTPTQWPARGEGSGSPGNSRPPNVILVEGGDSPELRIEVVRLHPRTPVLIVNWRRSGAGWKELLSAGFAGLLERPRAGHEVVWAVEDALAGGLILPASVARELWDGQLGRTGEAENRTARLTTGQAEILALVATGLTNKEVADRLHLSQYTVRNQLSKAYVRLGTPSRTAAAKLWFARESQH